MNATIKSGTNAIHGDAFEFIGNSDVDARNFFLPVSDSANSNMRDLQGGVKVIF